METHLLSEVEQELHLQPAPLGKRFLNLLLDIICFFAITLMIAIALGFASAGGSDSYTDDSDLLFQNFIVYLLYLAYYTLFEGLTKGRSLGKLITGTVAVKTDGLAITWKAALLRSLCRLVPFETLSAFGQEPWHDKWTKTKVIKKAK